MTLAALATVMAVHLAAAISPGPAFVVALRIAAAEGVRPALFLALGFGLGATSYAAAALLGLAALFAVFPDLMMMLRLGGALFLIFLAVMIYRNADTPLPAATRRTAPPRTALSAVRLGFLTQIANPKAAVFFGAVFMGLLPTDLSTAEAGVILAAILLVETAWYVIVALVFSRTRFRQAYGRVKSGFDRVLGGALAALGIRIALG